MITYHFKDSTYNAQFNLCFYSVDRFLMFVPDFPAAYPFRVIP